MCECSRRAFLGCAGALALAPASAGAKPAGTGFIEAAFDMKSKAVASGDQPYGAVLVIDGMIAGWGPSRVVVDKNRDAHAERVAMWDAQKRRGNSELMGAILYSTSIPCRDCQDFAARHGVATMIHGRTMQNAGRPLRYDE